LKVVKTPKGGSFASGSQLTYTIVVSNPATAGSSAATSVMLNDQLPGNGGLVWQTATATQGTCSIASNLLSCNLGTIAAGSSVTVTVKSTSTTTTAMCQSQLNPAAVATASGGLKAQDSGSQGCASGFTTFTQGGWGAPPHGNNPGALLKANFSTVFPSGVTIGTGKTAKFTSAAAIQGYLPAGGTGGAFTTSYVNPTSTSAGVLGGQLLSATLSVNFSNAGITKPGLGGLIVKSGPFAGDSVSQVLTIANTAIGGGGLPSGISFSDLTTVLDNINSNFDGGTTNHGFLY
jgi:uncharacterized repeat protein (TIGR01451 family)